VRVISDLSATPAFPLPQIMPVVKRLLFLREMKQISNYEFSHAQNHCTSSTMITVCIYKAPGASCAVIDAIISAGRPTFQCDLYFFLLNVACQSLSPFLGSVVEHVGHELVQPCINQRY